MAPQTAASVRGCLLLLLHRPVFRWNLLLHVHVHCEVVALLRARRCCLRCKDAVDTCNKKRRYAAGTVVVHFPHASNSLTRQIGLSQGY